MHQALLDLARSTTRKTQGRDHPGVAAARLGSDRTGLQVHANNREYATCFIQEQPQRGRHATDATTSETAARVPQN